MEQNDEAIVLKKVKLQNQKYIITQILNQGSFNHNQLLLFEEWKIKKTDAKTTMISAIELLKIKIAGIRQTHQDKNSEVIKILFLIIFS